MVINGGIHNQTLIKSHFLSFKTQELDYFRCVCFFLSQKQSIITLTPIPKCKQNVCKRRLITNEYRHCQNPNHQMKENHLSLYLFRLAMTDKFTLDLKIQGCDITLLRYYFIFILSYIKTSIFQFISCLICSQRICLFVEAIGL